MNRLPARALARMVREGEASAAEVLEAHLAAIARANPALNAFVTLAADQARPEKRVQSCKE